MNIIKYLKLASLSLTASGNTGISPFLTILTLLAIHRVNPYLLDFQSYLQPLAENWLVLSLTMICTLLEVVAKCFPKLNEIADTVLLFIIPFASVFATLCTFGVYDDDENDQQRSRQLGLSANAQNIVQILAILVGIALSITMHVFKTAVRQMGKRCFACFITVVEYSVVLASLALVLWRQEIAMLFALIYTITSLLTISRRWRNNVKKNSQDEELLDDYERFRNRQDQKVALQAQELEKLEMKHRGKEDHNPMNNQNKKTHVRGRDVEYGRGNENDTITGDYMSMNADDKDSNSVIV